MKTSTQIRVEDDLYEKVKYIAEKEYRSVNAQMEYFIALGVESYEDSKGYIIPTNN